MKYNHVLHLHLLFLALDQNHEYWTFS